MTEELFRLWRDRPLHVGRPFIEDGILDPPRWQNAPKRVLFLLKEAYDTTTAQDGFDLRVLVRDRWKGPRGSTWWRMANWAYLIQQSSPGYVPPYPSRAAATDALMASAVINIKKSDGRTRSDREDIDKYARADAELLLAQIQEAEPDIIVGGGVWSAAQVVFPEMKRMTDRVHRTRAGPFVNFWHPAAQLHNRLLYFGLAGILQAAYGKQPDLLRRLSGAEVPVV